MSSVYPLWIEKMIFLVLVASSVYAGIELQNHLTGAMLWLSWVCGLPLVVLVTTEGIGRIVQKINTR
ncbi:MAG: hypothetical protein DWC06_06290 [Candidatus Poseidoniales archaeon]|nr:hypothetical protein [Candidatus Poseidoniales archaeon]RJV00378.1 MAG: hypothetical protein DWC06_06290 [Candidatus Poseidoniales archaeon]